MAETFPETLINLPNVIPGEIRVFDLLKNVLNDQEYIVWFEPKISGRTRTLYPDIIIWSRVTGLVILEVKDWVIKDLVEVNSNIVKMKKGGETVNLKNPECQVREYVNNAMNSLKKLPDLTIQEGRYKGGLKFPVGYGVVFTNITRKEFEMNSLGSVITAETLTLDEIEKIEQGGNDIILVSKLRKMGNHFPFDDLSTKELDKLRAILFPRIIIPKLEDSTSYPSNVADKSDKTINYDLIKVLDKNQERIAFSIGSGHRIIKGAAGSGKTLLLAYRAIILKKFQPNWKILILCYNITLRNYMRDLLRHIGEEENIDANTIEVYHFHDFVYNKIGIPQIKKFTDPERLNKVFADQTNWNEYQNLLGSLLMDNIDRIPEEIYDAILIDECQDLTTNYIKYIVHILNKKTDHLLIAIDPAQNIYGGKISWKSVGVNAKGRVSNLQISYRNTKEILDVAYTFNNQKIEKLYKEDSDLPLFPEQTERHGQKPKIIEFDDSDSMIHFITQAISKSVTMNKYKFSDFGILYPTKPTNLFLDNLRSGFNSLNVNYDFIEKKDDRLNFQINKDSCKIMNIFNAKGYEFKVVFLLNIERYMHGPNDEMLKRNTVFVGLTRAMQVLTILTLKNNGNSRFISELKEILK